MRAAPAAALAVFALVPAAAPPQERPEPAAPVVTSLTVFAGTPDGLFRSRDWGGTWQPAVTADKTFGLDEVGWVRDVLPIGPQVFLGGDGGVYQSEDFGETWRRTAVGAPVVRILPSRYPQSDPTVFAATGAGLLKSPDGGRTFVATPLGGTPVYRLEWPGPALVAATGRGVLVSMDSGLTWKGPEGGLPSGDVRALALSSFYAIDPVIFAGVGSAGVYRSSNGGRTWEPAGLPGHEVTDLAWLGPYLYALSGGGVFRSEDRGASWTRLTNGLAVAPTRVLFPLMPTSGAEAFLGTVSGIFRSSDGGQTWRAAGMSGRPILCLATFPQAELGPRGKPPKVRK